MSDISSVSKLLQVIKALLHNRYANVDELSEQLNISPRTLYRYLKDLRDNGFVIRKAPGNVYRLEKVSRKTRDLRDLLYFTDEEAYILKAAIESIDETNVLKQNLKKKLYSIYDYKLVADIVVSPKTKNNVHNIIDAIQNKRQVVLRSYSSAHSNTVSDRLVEPFALTTNYVQVWCYDIAAQAVRFYRISRIGKVDVLKEHWQHESSHVRDAEDIFRSHGPISYPIHLILSIRAANLLREEYPVAERYLSEREDGRWDLCTEVTDYNGPARFILGLYDDVEIVGNDELKAFVAEKISRMKA